MNHLAELRIRDIWEYVKSEDLLFWLVNIYLFFEYVRPQTIYPAIDVLPYAQSIIIVTFLLLFVKGNGLQVANVENKLFILFFFIVLISSFLALNPSVSYSNLYLIISWLLIYLIIINTINTENRFFVLLLAFLLYNFKMAFFAFRNWASIGFSFSGGGTGGGPGWFHNAGEFGIEMCIFLPLAAYFAFALYKYLPKWKTAILLFFAFTALTGPISSASRGAVLGAAAVIGWMWLKSRHKVKGLFVVVIVGVIALSLMPQPFMERFETAGEDRTSETRLERWDKGLELAQMYPVFGVGYHNWAVADRQIFGGPGGLSHNIFIDCMSQMGFAGLIVYLLMIFFVFWNNYQTRKIVRENDLGNFMYYTAHGLDAAQIGFMVSGSFVSVLFYPYFWINLAMTVALNNSAKNELTFRRTENEAQSTEWYVGEMAAHRNN
jgi:O-antigen ligase